MLYRDAVVEAVARHTGRHEGWLMERFRNLTFHHTDRPELSDNYEFDSMVAYESEVTNLVTNHRDWLYQLLEHAEENHVA
jgi:hypothetical protein